MRNAFLCSAAAAAIALAAPHGAWAGSAALPTGGGVQSGQATIAASGPGALTINQSSKAAIIDWSSFSIGQGGSVQFNNGSGATLNRVLSGGPISTIDGRLSATGSVYLINPSGVIIGKHGVVQVGGTFAASTLDVDDGAFLNGAALTFSGQSKASVVNLGKVEALGGDVVLAAAVVKNAGTLLAPEGEVGLLAGYNVTLKDQADQNGLFTVQIGGAGTSVTNQGLIAATTAELRANGGNIYALAGDTASVIKATEVTHQGGQIFLTAPGGTVSVASGVTLDASATGSGDGGHILVDSASTSFHGTALARGGALGGDGGLVETSGGTLDFSGAKVVTTAAHGATGTWLLDPYDLTVNPAGATAIENGLATNNVTVETTGAQNPAFGVINPMGSGDIVIAAPISWSSGHTLTLDAYHSLHVDAAITVAGGGGVVIKTDDGGSGGDYDFGLTSTGFSGAVSYTGGASSGASLTINGTPYTLLYSMSDVQAINASDTALQGNYALAANLDGSTTGSWTPIGTDGVGTTPLNSGNGFSGAFTGLGHTISNLTVDRSSTTGIYVGLFGYSTGAIRDVGLAGGSVSGKSYVGGLDGYERAGTISDAFATGTVSGGGYYVGGLVGASYGVINNVYATGAVQAGGYAAGGLVGFQTGGAISNAYATGAVSSAGGYAGGLVGEGIGAISNAYATGAVSGPGGQWYVGGLVGYFGYDGASSITNAYATGAVSGGVNVGGLVGEMDTGVITNAHATGTVTGSTGSFDVGGLVGGVAAGTITNAYATGAVSGGNWVGGLIGWQAGGAISNVFATGTVAGDTDDVGGLVGYLQAGAITGAYATGTVSAGGDGAGGLVGQQDAGTITNAYATGAVTGVTTVGGLVGGQAGGSISNAYATGAVSAAEWLGGLVGYSGGGTVANGYFDTQTTGQASDGTGSSGVGLTTRQLQGLDLISGSTYFSAASLGDSTGSVWGAGGGVLPYLKAFVVNTIAGTVYSDYGVTPLGGATVVEAFVAGGAAISTATSVNATGAYSVAAPGANGTVILFLDHAGKIADTVVSYTGSSLTGVNLYGGYLTFANVSASTLSGTLGPLAGFALPTGYGAGDFLLSVGGSTVTPTGGLAIDGAGGFAFDQSLNLGSNPLEITASGAVTQTAGTSIQAGSLSGSAASLALTNASNTISSVGAFSTSSGGLALASSGDLTVSGAVSGSGGVELLSGGGLTIGASGSVAAQAAGQPVVLAATGAFTNDAGSSAVSTPNGSWLIYSSAPGADVFGGLNSNNTAVWGTAPGGSVSLSGNRYVFAYQPTLTVTTTSDSKTSGTDASSQIQADYTITGFAPGVTGAFLGDTAASAYAGAPSLASAGASANAAAGSYAITASLGALTSASGYAFKFADTGVLTADPAAPSSPSGPSSPVAPQVPFEPANGANTSLFNTPTSNGGSGFDLLSEAGSDTTSNTQPSPGSNPASGGSGLPNGGSTPSVPDQGQGPPGNTPYPGALSGWSDIRFEGGIQ